MNSAKLKTTLSKKVQDAQTEPLEGNIAYMPNTSLAPSQPSHISLPPNALDIINENLKNKPLSIQSIDIIKSPTGGTTAFTVPSISGDEMQKELVGVILDYSYPRAYWETPDPVEGTPPNCYSLDSIVSHDGKPCYQCMYNEFGTKGGDSEAKACKEYVLIYLLRQGNIMPIIVRVPVTSKVLFQKYLTRLVSNMIPICGVVTKITLEKTTNKAGQPYAKYIFEATDTLTDAEINGLKVYSQKIMSVLSAVNEQELGDVV